METTTLLMTLFLSLAPISELRGAIPFAVMRGVELMPAVLLAVGANLLVPLIAFLFLSTLHRVLYRLDFYRNFFDKVVERTRKKVHAKVERFGYFGLLVFVAIPLPVTGAWTGALGAWILGMEWKKSTLAIAGGVIVAGVIVAILVSLLGAGAQTIFFKKI